MKPKTAFICLSLVYCAGVGIPDSYNWYVASIVYYISILFIGD